MSEGGPAAPGLSAGFLRQPRGLLPLDSAQVRGTLALDLALKARGTARIVLFKPGGYAVGFGHAAPISLLLLLRPLPFGRRQDAIGPTFNDSEEMWDRPWRTVDPRPFRLPGVEAVSGGLSTSVPLKWPRPPRAVARGERCDRVTVEDHSAGAVAAGL
jgi:hypothetical protein